MDCNNHPTGLVIVRAWGDEPVRLLAYRVDFKAKTTWVGGPSCRRPIGLPSWQVFVFQGETFERLQEAYMDENKTLLHELYLSCIKYQDSLESLHGQERLANPGRPSDRSQQ